MADSHTKVRDVAWLELFPWLSLLRSVRIALMARILVLGALGLIATTAGWLLLVDIFQHSTDPVIAGWRQNTSLEIWRNAVRMQGDSIWVNTAAHSASEVLQSAHEWLLRAPVMIWTYMTRPFVAMFDSHLTPTGFIFLLFCGAWELLVWGLFGGAITRIAALKFTRDEAPGIVAALKHAISKWPSYSLPPLVALAGASVFAIQLLILGLIMRIDVFAFLAAIIWPFVILLGLMMAILLIGAVVGWPLMWATVSVEGTDAFDALSRSYAYTYHRPWRLLWYVLFALFLAIVSMFVVKVFASSAIALGNWSVDWGLDNETMRTVVAPLPPPNLAPRLDVTTAPSADGNVEAPPANAANPPELGGTLSATKSIIGFWKAVVAVLVAGYQAGFLWVAAVGIYLLLRRDIDGVQTSEVFVDQADEFGMPPLAADAATGVPEVAPPEPALPGDGSPIP
ncbi:MAG TPA: hypothetical protein VHE81_12890 [Lacipirellulaceae bacterium]|nr:hypothetical protein [Lacipirellulaceae bacterium]